MVSQVWLRLGCLDGLNKINLKDKTMTKELTKTNNKPVVHSDNGLYLDTAKFEHGWRVASMLAESTMVPEHFRNNVGNCMIALNLASRVELDPFMLMQKMYIIKGKPGIEGQLVIALVNKTGKFSALEFELSGEGNDRQCYAYATKVSDGKLLKGPVVSLKMAAAEGWSSKGGSKWKTLPDLMLMYRSASFFCGVYCPEAKLGMMTKEEIIDTSDYTPAAEPVAEINDVFIEPGKIVEIEDKPLAVLKTTSQMKDFSETAYDMVHKELGLPKNSDDLEKFNLRFDEVIESTK